MGNNTIGFNTDEMRNWSHRVAELADDYDGKIKLLYTSVEGFVNSRNFRGEVASALYTGFINRKQAFMDYSTTFRECAELIRNNAGAADNSILGLKSQVDRMNPLG